METRRQNQSQSPPILSTSTGTRKRKARTSPSTDDNSGDDVRKRGRARVEKPDQSAADRRRTQIRMAQRAYRQRKESTLEELRKRISELTNTIELMNKAFLNHRDRLCQTSLSGNQLNDIRETAIHFESLMKCMRNPTEDCFEDLSPSIHQEPPSPAHESNNKPAQAALEPKNVPSWIDRSALMQQQETTLRDPTSVGLGYTMYMQDEAHNGNIEHNPRPVFDASALIPASKETFDQQQNDFDVFRLQVPEIAIPESLSPPRTYSFQESTFGRRLYRSALEQAYHLMLDPSRHPGTYERVFRLSLMNRNHEKILMQMRAALQASAHESLFVDTAFIHVGGAGTHFPRKDQYGNLHPKREAWHMGIVGPQTLAVLENAVKDNITVDMTVEIAGFEGEWFDPYDVEGYLAEKGIFIDPKSSFAEGEVIVQSVPSSNTSATESSTLPYPSSVDMPLSSSPYQQSRGPRPFDRDQLELLELQSVGVGELDPWGSASPFSTAGFSDAATGSWMNFLLPGEMPKSQMLLDPHILKATDADAPTISWEGSKSTEYLPQLDGTAVDKSAGFMSKSSDSEHLGKSKRTIVDVAKFLKILTVSGVCLSRVPGYRRKDVDRALALSTFDAL